MAVDINRLKKKSVAGVVSYSIRSVAVYLIAIVATALLSAYLDPDEFGIYFIVTSLIGVFTFLSDVGLAAALVQKKSEPTVEEMRTTFVVQQVLAFTIFFTALALTPIWRRYTDLGTEGIQLLYVLAFSFVIASFKTIPSILLERKLEFNRLVIPTVVEQLVFYSVAVMMAIQGYGVTSFTYAVLLRGIAGVITMYVIQTWPIGVAISRKALGHLMKFGVQFQANDLLARLKDDLYIVVLAKFLTQTEMGYIGWAKRWSMFPYQFSVNNVVAISFPTYSRLQEHKQELRRAIEKSLFFIALMIFPVLVGMSVMAYPLTVVIEAYTKWQPALPSLYLFCVNVAWAAMSTPLTNTLNAIGQISKTLRLMIMWTSLTWILTPFALRFFGFTGVAVVAALVSVTSVVTIWMVKKVVDLSFFEQIWRQLIASGVMGMVLWVTVGYWTQSLFWLIAGVILGGAVYMGVQLIIGYEKTVREIGTLARMR